MRLRALLQQLGARGSTQGSPQGSTADVVYRVLRHGIVHGDLAPGERLRSDALASELQVSRTPVREALRKLEAEGLAAHAGARLIVRAFTEQDLTELFYVREALEGMAARLAAENATAAEIEDIRALLDDMDAVQKRGDVDALRALTGEFHQMVSRASHNSRLAQSLRSLLDHVRQVQSSTLYAEGRPAEALKEHRSLLAAIAAGDGDRAERLAREHRRKTLELRRAMLREQLRRSRSGGERRGNDRGGD